MEPSLGRGRARIRKLVGDASKSLNPRAPGPPTNITSAPGTLSRGSSNVSVEEISQIEGGVSSLKASETDVNSKGPTTTQESPREVLEKDLENLKENDRKCLIRTTIEFFTHDNDIAFYLDKVVSCALESSAVGTKFAMSLKFLTFHKTYGEDLKKEIFRKLQSTFKEMDVFMKDVSNLAPDVRRRLVNFCNLIGQIYFRFRPHLEKPEERYFILAIPTLSCLNYLISASGTAEMRMLAQLFMMNCKALCEKHKDKDKVFDLCNKVRSALLKKELTNEERLWLLCVIDLFHLQDDHLPDNLAAFYSSQVGEELWRETTLQKTKDNKIVLLAYLPIDFNINDKKIFDMDPMLYTRYRFVDL